MIYFIGLIVLAVVALSALGIAIMMFLQDFIVEIDFEPEDVEKGP